MASPILWKRLIRSKDLSLGQIASGSHSPNGPIFPGSIETCPKYSFLVNALLHEMKTE